MKSIHEDTPIYINEVLVTRDIQGKKRLQLEGGSGGKTSIAIN